MKVLFIGGEVFGSFVLSALAETRHTVVAVVEVSGSKGFKRFLRRPLLNCPILSRIYCQIKCKIKKNVFYKTIIKYGLHLVKFESVNEEKFLRWLKSKDPDLILVAACFEIFKKEILNFPRLGCINCHPSLLPKYRGPNPIPAVIIMGEKETGVTYHYMDERIDTGCIISQEKLSIQDNDTGGELLRKCGCLARKNLTKILDVVEKGKIRPYTQNSLSASYFGKIPEGYSIVNWKKRAGEIYNQVRGLTPWVKCYTYFKGKKLYLQEVSVVKNDNISSNLSPGSLIRAAKEELLVQCIDLALRIKKYSSEKFSQRRTQRMLQKELHKRKKIIFN